MESNHWALNLVLFEKLFLREKYQNTEFFLVLNTSRKQSYQLKSSLTNVFIFGGGICWGHSPSCFLKFCVPSNQWKNTLLRATWQTLAQVFSYELCKISKNTFSFRTPLVAASVERFLIKMTLTLIPMDSVTNWLLYIFCSFVWSKNKNHLFRMLVVLLKEIFLFFVYSESHSTSKASKFNRVL